MEKQSEQREEQNKIYLTSENSPALKKAMDKISAELLERNKKLYRRLGGQKIFVQHEGFFFTLKNFLCYNPDEDSIYWNDFFTICKLQQ